MATRSHSADDARHGVPTVYSPLALVVRRAPVTAPYDGSVADAVRTMAAEQVSSIIVVDPATGAPLGIFTLRDLLRRLVLENGGLDPPIAAAMTAGLVTLPTTATAHQAATLMGRRRLHHVVVTDGQGQLVGVVTQTDLIGLSRLGAQELSSAISESGTLEALADRLGVRVIGRPTALGDALVTGEIFLRLLPLLAALGIVTLRQTRDASRRTYRARLTY